MTSHWDIYDALIDDLPEDVTVTVSDRGARWTRVLNSAGGVGSAWTMRGVSRPALSADLPDAGRPVRDVAALVRSWNLAEASVGLWPPSTRGTPGPRSPLSTASCPPARG